MTMRRTDLILSLALLAVVTVPAGAQTVRELTPEEEKARRELLFNQTNEKVRQAREAAARAAS